MKYKNNLNVFTYGYLPIKFPQNWWKNIKQFFRNIKYAFQRATKGYSDYDRWSIDIYLAYLLPAMLLDMKENTVGYPALEGLSSPEEWDKILEEMAEHFHNTLCWDESIPINKQIMEAYDKMDAHILTPEKIFSEDCEYDDKEAYRQDQKIWLELENKGSQFREDEKNLACDMLKTWFFNLWD